MPVKKFQSDFFILLGCAVLFAVGLVFWLAPGSRGELVGGLQVGSIAPRIEAEGWLNSEGPTPESLAGQVVVVEAWRLG